MPFPQMGIIRLHLVQFTEVKNSGTPVRKLGGFSGTQGYWASLFATGGMIGARMKKSSNTAKYGAYKGLRW